VNDITKDRSDVVKLAGTNNQTGGGVYHHLQTAGDLCRCTVQNAVTIVNPSRNEGCSQSTSSVDCQGPPYTSKLPELVEAATDEVPDVLVHRQFTVNNDAEVTNFVQRRSVSAD